MGTDSSLDLEPFTEWYPAPPAARQIYCNRTLNLRSIRAIGFDMDYTLVHYNAEAWERRAYEHVQRRLIERGWPVADLQFDPRLVSLGLIVDKEKGNIVKANRFGYVKRASHGTRMLDYDEQRREYSRVVIDLHESRWEFLNTLFGLSEACIFSQLVDLLDAKKLDGVLGYPELYKIVRASIDETHMEGALKAEIIAEPDRYVMLDEELPLALFDLAAAGKKLLLITNSEWQYTSAMMAYAFDRFMPKGTTWRSLFELVIVAARKPNFFTHKGPIFEVVDEEGLLRPVVGALKPNGIYLGGHARAVEQHLQLPGEEILYVGDHIFADVNVTKNLLRWRTALVLRELEEELVAVEEFREAQERLSQMMELKMRMEYQYSQLRLHVQRAEHKYGPASTESEQELRGRMRKLRNRMVALDEQIAPLAKASSELLNPRWGLLMRAGNDKSHLARQIERYADIYTSRVANLLLRTPFEYLRSPRGSLPHDPTSGF